MRNIDQIMKIACPVLNSNTNYKGNPDEIQERGDVVIAFDVVKTIKEPRGIICPHYSADGFKGTDGDFNKEYSCALDGCHKNKCIYQEGFQKLY